MGASLWSYNNRYHHTPSINTPSSTTTTQILYFFPNLPPQHEFYIFIKKPVGLNWILQSNSHHQWKNKYFSEIAEKSSPLFATLSHFWDSVLSFSKSFNISTFQTFQTHIALCRYKSYFGLLGVQTRNQHRKCLWKRQKVVWLPDRIPIINPVLEWRKC